MKKYLPYLLILALLAGAAGWFLYRYSPSTIEKIESNFAVDDVQAIHRIVLKAVDGHQMELTHEPQGWLIDHTYPVNEATLSLLMTAIQKVRPKNVVPPTMLENVLKDMHQSSTRIEIYDGANALMKAYTVGGPTSNGEGTFMILEVDGHPAKQAYITGIPGQPSYLTQRYYPSLDNWRNRWVFREDHSSIEALQVNYHQKPDRSFELQRISGTDSFVMKQHGVLADEQPKQRHVWQYLDFYAAISMEAYENKNPIKDSILRQNPYCTITVKAKNKSVEEAVLYYMPLNERSVTRVDSEGRPLLYDSEHFYATVHNGHDFVLVQYYVWGNILRQYSEFYLKPGTNKKGSD